MVEDLNRKAAERAHGDLTEFTRQNFQAAFQSGQIALRTLILVNGGAVREAGDWPVEPECQRHGARQQAQQDDNSAGGVGHEARAHRSGPIGWVKENCSRHRRAPG